MIDSPRPGMINLLRSAAVLLMRFLLSGGCPEDQGPAEVPPERDASSDPAARAESRLTASEGGRLVLRAIEAREIGV